MEPAINIIEKNGVYKIKALALESDKGQL